MDERLYVWDLEEEEDIFAPILRCVFVGVINLNLPFGVVMVAAMTLNLLLTATAGVLIPLLRQRLGRDPALGSSVLITALTDSGGFFIFLGLATLFLL